MSKIDNLTLELLGEVLGKDILLYHVTGRKNNKTIQYSTGYTNYHQHSINTYELEHKCIEWAWDNNYEFVVRFSNIELYDIHKQVYVYGDFELDNGFNPEAIFKACEWILDNKEK